MELERKIEFLRPAWDHILHPDPKTGKNRGRGSVEMRFILRDENVAVTWGIITGWNLPETDEALREIVRHDHPDRCPHHSMGTAVCTHVASKNRDYHQDEPIPCDALPGEDRTCYGDCGFLAGDELFKKLVRDGEEAVWKEMEAWHADASKPEEENADNEG